MTLYTSPTMSYETSPFISIDQSTFDSTWSTTDDRVMGGQSYSYATYDSAGFGVFNGTAIGDGGGFSYVQYKPESGVMDTQDNDGVVLRVSSQDNRIYNVRIKDNSWRFFSASWSKSFEV